MRAWRLMTRVRSNCCRYRNSHTRPTAPHASCTLIPRGCMEEPVSTRCTTPGVTRPLRWLCFSMIETAVPGCTLLLQQPALLLLEHVPRMALSLLPLRSL